MSSDREYTPTEKITIGLEEKEAKAKILDCLEDSDGRFYIGKSSVEPKEDKRKEYVPDKYTHWEPIKESKYADELEVLLIPQFRDHLKYRSRCNNENDGGGGTPNATYVYLAYSKLEERVGRNLKAAFDGMN